MAMFCYRRGQLCICEKLCEMQGCVARKTKTGNKEVVVLDSVRATKALAAIDELVTYSLKNSKYFDLCHDEIDAILIKYGFMPCK